MKLTREQACWLRMRGQRLLPQHSAGSGPNVALEVARITGGLQAQDLFAAALGVRVRAPESSLTDFERSRITDRSVIWTWLMRGTLHVAPTGDIDWLLAVLGPPLIAATARRRAEVGLDAETYTQGLTVVLDRLAAFGPHTREELGRALADVGLPNGYAIERHLLFRAALEGHICFGPDRGDAPGVRPTFTLMPEWIGRPLVRLAGDDLLAAQARLARRYVDAFAPAALADFSTWAGLNIRDLRAAWEEIKGELVEVEVDGAAGFLPAARMAELDEPSGFPVVRLLPAFDTYMLGHKNRDLIDDGRYANRLMGGGILPPVILVDGRIEGTWRTNRKGRRVAVSIDPFQPLAPDAQAAVADEMADIKRFV